jgi:prephenate dehydrogenase
MQPRHLSILGVGLLGGSIGLAVRSRIKECRITGYGHRASTLAAARDLGAIDEGYEQPGPAVRGADWVILCTPVSMLGPLLAQIAPELAEGTIVTDVGSTKRSIVAAAEALLPPGIHFVGSHPMAGSEKRGVEFARADLFDGAVCITTPTPQTNAPALEAVESFWKTLGMRTTRLSPDMHDQLLADVSHLPHVLAAALVAMQDERAFQLCGKGFADMTRIASGDAGLWRDILLDNRDNVRASIRRLQENLEKVSALLEGNESEVVHSWLQAAAMRRQARMKNSAPQ